MAVSRLLFNTQTLAILNMLNPNETISYDWSIDEDYSIVLLEGSINLQDNTVLTGVTEHRVQPNIMLSATGLGSTRSYFISLFRIDDDNIADQIVSSASKTRMRTFAPTWIDDGYPSDPEPSWESTFASGHYVLTKNIIDTQIANSNWD